MNRARLRAGRTLSLMTALTLGATGAQAGGTVVRVPADHPTLQAAVNAAADGATILVADGLYTGVGNRDVDLGAKQLVIRSENGPQTCVIDCQGTIAEPHRAIVIQGGQTRATRIEGLTIRGGTTLQGAIADPFNGGAIQILGSSPTISNCVFTQNECACWGGAVYSAHGGAPLIENCSFIDNHSGDDGGGFFCWNEAAPVVVSSIFVGNSADVQGGAVANFGFNMNALTFVNVTMHGNTAPFGSAVAGWGRTDIRNSILWGNLGSEDVVTGQGVAISNSDVQGGFPGPGNVNVDPQLAKDGCHLLAGSPCIDAGVAEAQLSDFDIDGQPRTIGAQCDMGADEHVGFATRR